MQEKTKFLKKVMCFALVLFMMTGNLCDSSAASAATKPARPTITKISNTASGIKLAWDAVSKADSYCVYYKTSTSSDEWTKLTTTTKTSYTDKKAKSGKKRYYSVRAKRSGTYSSRSKTKSLTRLDTVASEAVNKASYVKLSWEKVPGAESYTVYRKKTGSSSYSKLDSSEGTSYKDTSAESGIAYTYSVRACKGSTKSAHKALKHMFLKAPAVTVTPSYTSIQLKWKAVNGSTYYKIQSRKKDTDSWSTKTTVSSDASLKYVYKTSSHDAVSFRVRAYNEAYSSAYTTVSECIKECTEHAFTETVITEPDCLTDGLVKKACKNCKFTTEEVLPRLGHKNGTGTRENEIKATCTEAGSYDLVVRCERCGETVSSVSKTVKKKGHSYDAGKVTKEATCTEDGLKTFTCKNCGSTKTEKIASSGHVPSEPTRENETRDGYDLVTRCSVCNAVLSSEKITNGCTHTYDAGKVTKATTCTADGVKTYTCTKCKAAKTEVIEKTGHTPGKAVKENVVEADCEKAGSYDMVTRCTKCNAVTDKQTTTVKANGHTYDAGKVTKEATCTADGVKTYTCTKCNATKIEVITKTGHTAGSAVKENETEKGYDLVTRCKTCNAVLSSEYITKACSHTYDAGKVTKAATCTESGVKTYTCTKCNATKTEEIPVTDHTYDSGKVTKEATCTESGVKTYTCTKCKAVKTETIKASGHTEGKAVKENVVAATCEKAGSYESVTRCTKCNNILDRNVVSVKASGHTAGEPVKENETTKGYDLVTRCKNCDKIIDCEYVSKTCSHSYDPGKVTKAATCTADGIKTYTCTKCNAAKTETIPATGHSYDSGKVTKEATCTAEGIKTYTCTKCNASKTEAVKATGHTAGTAAKENVVEATCEKMGSFEMVTRCTKCNAVLDSEYSTVKATGHSYDSGKVTTASTCTERGVKTYTCTKCKATKTESVPEAGHSAGTAVKENIVEATCENAGSYDMVTYCTKCNGVVDAVHHRVNATGHSYDSGKITKAATCTEEGVKTYTCSKCNATKTESIAKTSHTAGSAVKENVVAATCEKAGSYDLVTRCTKCNTVLSSQASTEKASGHTYDTGKVTKAATCTSEGVKTYTCTKCNATKTEAVAKTAHSYDAGKVTKAATCSAEGVKTYTCTKCSAVKTESVPTISHTWKDYYADVTVYDSKLDYKLVTGVNDGAVTLRSLHSDTGSKGYYGYVLNENCTYARCHNCKQYIYRKDYASDAAFQAAIDDHISYKNQGCNSYNLYVNNYRKTKYEYHEFPSHVERKCVGQVCSVCGAEKEHAYQDITVDKWICDDYNGDYSLSSTEVCDYDVYNICQNCHYTSHEHDFKTEDDWHQDMYDHVDNTPGCFNWSMYENKSYKYTDYLSDGHFETEVTDSVCLICGKHK